VNQNRWLYPYDAEEDTKARWSEVSSKVQQELDSGVITPLFGEDGPPRVLTVRDAYGKVKDVAQTQSSLLTSLTV
jgi:salicylate hydroxylase